MVLLTNCHVERLYQNVFTVRATCYAANRGRLLWGTPFSRSLATSGPTDVAQVPWQGHSSTESRCACVGRVMAAAAARSVESSVCRHVSYGWCSKSCTHTQGDDRYIIYIFCWSVRTQYGLPTGYLYICRPGCRLVHSGGLGLWYTYP